MKTFLQCPIRLSGVALVSLLLLGALSVSLFLFFMGPRTASWYGGTEQIPHPRPVVVLIEEDPWLTVIGSDMPRLAIYDDGTIIYRLDPEKHPSELENEFPSYNQAVLSEGEMNELFAKLNPTAFRELKGFYNVTPNVTDEPTVDLYLYADGVEKAVSVYGFGCENDGPPPSERMPDDPKPYPLPAQFGEAYAALVSLSPKASEKWIPPELELMVWPFEYAKETIPWPSGWPTLSDPRTVNRHEDSYSLYMPGTKLEEVQAFLKARNGAVTLEGEKWSIGMRYPFPGEPTWDKAFSEITRWWGDPTSVSSENEAGCMSAELREALSVCRSLPDYEQLHDSFEIEDATLGFVNFLPESLVVQLRSTKPRTIDAAWWWNPLSDKKPSLTWHDFLTGSRQSRTCHS